ncbi:RNA polymerase sigma factor [Actinoplanes subtropicus]|uniref:RNA polymerase sigma factor n=1 Tax=Actinoplanes subtropicus TaxID=543632 RepID=UPI000A06F16F|nr:RNA polymerase sigma factor [Actinoplanes subtropicus]
MEAVTGAAGRSWRWVATGRGSAEPAGEATDAAVLAAIAAGDGGALSELYRRHARALFGYLLRVCGDRMTAEEILQDTLLAVWRGADTFEARSSVRTWLFAVARRQAYQRLRLQPAPVPVEPAEVADAAPGPDELAVLASGGTAVAGAIARLAAHHRDVIGLAMVAGLPLAEVAEIIGVPVGTVKSRLFHGRAALARMLAEEGRRA